ncbi:MAG: addiction module antitoxin RelB [Candidatus Parabeggiatoa sp. nov. 2]|nr:MAG: hypothetical protein B6247_21240 [Beggiatoa sp. 4572_84]RKZ59039.1 MAG: addiction module antitoxin RelB [Gammaproteobacteria bacterium]
MTKVEFILNETLSMNSYERAMMAHCLISSIDHPTEDNIDQAWLKLAENRLSELENNQVKPVSWDELKQKIRDS